MTIVSLSFAFYCCYVHQQLGKVKTYSVNSPNSIEKYNVEPYLTTAGQSCAAIDPVYSDIKWKLVTQWQMKYPCFYFIFHFCNKLSGIYLHLQDRITSSGLKNSPAYTCMMVLFLEIKKFKNNVFVNTLVAAKWRNLAHHGYALVSWDGFGYLLIRGQANFVPTECLHITVGTTNCVLNANPRLVLRFRIICWQAQKVHEDQETIKK